MNRLLIPLLWMFVFIVFDIKPGTACTTGMASSKVTSNQHTLLWKNRDSSFIDNEIAFFKYSDVQYLGLISTNDTTQVWAGVNNYGFAIMNAESRDMAVPGENTGYDDEGIWMKTALKCCRTVDDFEEMLRSSNETGRKVTSNFGVTDASGNAAYFETGNHEYFRFDATEPGYLVRANFAYKARSEEGYGRVRHDRAVYLFKDAIVNNVLDYTQIASMISTDIILPDSLLQKMPAGQRKTQDTINRYRSVAATVFDSYPNNEHPELTTFWCTLGEPALSISIPLWVISGQTHTVLDSDSGSVLNNMFQEIKSAVYIDKDHMDLNRLEIVRKITIRTQQKIYRQTAWQLQKWEKTLPAMDEVALFQEKMIKMATNSAKRVLRSLKSQ